MINAIYLTNLVVVELSEKNYAAIKHLSIACPLATPGLNSIKHLANKF